jgi:hypothetical protein
MVTSDGSDPGQLSGAGDDPFVAGWWVGADGYWHPPDEPFGSEGRRPPHRLRRMVVVGLAVVVVLATSVGVWGGLSSTSTSSGPSLDELTLQVQRAISGSGAGAFGIRGVTDVKCDPPTSWSAGRTFTCDVFGSARMKLGRYHGTVQPDSSSGQWRWEGTWTPSHSYSVS